MRINAFRLWSAFSVLMVILTITSCEPGRQKGMISGKFRGVEGRTIYLQRLVNNKMITIDSTVVGADGQFALVPEEPLNMDFYYLMLTKDDGITLITDSSESVSVSGDLSNLAQTVTVSGSINTESIREYEIECAPLLKKDKEALAKMNDASLSPEAKSQHKQQVIENQKKRVEITKKWLESNSSTLGAILVVRQLDPRTDGASYNRGGIL